jgi:hypothetical protein
VAVPINKTDPRHRKVIRYEPYADASDVDNGHGTHVCGTLAGNALCDDCSGKLFDGNAPDAKLYFVDAGYPDSPSELGAEYDLEEVLDRSVELKSGIMSNSWGYEPFEPTIRELFDEVGFLYPEITFFFGSGNSRKSFDIWSPGNSKNIIGVGGTNRPQAADALGDHVDNYYYVNVGDRSEKATAKGRSLLAALHRDPIKSYVDQPIGSSFWIFNESSDCSQIPADAVLILTDGDRKACSNSVPWMKVSSGLLNEAMRVGRASVTVNYTSEAEGSSFSIAGFTSMGPSNTGIIKPDIVSPGKDIQSACARSIGRTPVACVAESVISKSGTSMATPMTAGAATLALQYFHDGFYPSGMANESNYMKVTSDLMRAVIANSGGPLRDGELKPTMNKGFGVMHLSNTFVFADDERITRFGFRISNALVFTHGCEAVATVVTTSDTSPLTVTVAWIDPSTALGFHEPVYADIDLYIETPSGKYIHGNELGDFEDTHATTERIIIETPEVGTYKVFLHVPDVPRNDPIRTSVVVNGPFPHLNFGLNPEYLNFTVGQYNRSCPFGRTGTRCQTEVLPWNVQAKLTARKPAYRYYQIPDTAEAGDSVVVRFGGANVPGTGLFQLSISLDQVAKFGGIHLFFSNFSIPDFAILIQLENHPEIRRGSVLYFTLYEAVEGSRTITIDAKYSVRTPNPTPAPAPSPTALADLPPKPSQSTLGLPPPATHGPVFGPTAQFGPSAIPIPSPARSPIPESLTKEDVVPTTTPRRPPPATGERSFGSTGLVSPMLETAELTAPSSIPVQTKFPPATSHEWVTATSEAVVATSEWNDGDGQASGRKLSLAGIVGLIAIGAMIYVGSCFVGARLLLWCRAMIDPGPEREGDGGNERAPRLLDQPAQPII